MVGAILHQEMLLGGRRNRLHVFRWIYAGWLVLIVVSLYGQFLLEEQSVAFARMMSGFTSTEQHASAPQIVGYRFATMFVWQQTLLLMLVTPIFTAGAIIDEKRQGTLSYLLLSEVEVRQILVGKLLGRLAQIALWLMAGLPLFAVLAGFGGVEPITLVFLYAGLVMPALAIISLSLLASVYCLHTRDAVLLVYLFMVAGWLGVKLVGGPLRYLDPLWVLDPVWETYTAADLTEALFRLLISASAWGAISVAALLIAGVWMLPLYRRELEKVRATRQHWYLAEREPVEDDPVRWREQHVEGLAPNATLRRVPMWLGIMLVALLTTLSSVGVLYASLAPGASVVDVMEAMLQLNIRQLNTLLPDASSGFLTQGIVVMLLGSLIVGVRCAGAITQERERQTWEALLLTPISAKQIARGKLWGVLRASYWYLVAYAAPAVSLSVLGGFMALIYTLVWLAATGLAMYFIGAAGLWCSVRSTNAWKSLLQAMALGYLGGLVISLVTSPVMVVAAFVLWILLLLLDLFMRTNLFSLTWPAFSRMFSIGTVVGLALGFWFIARWFLNGVQRWIADRDRTRFWEDAPVYRRSRPQLEDKDRWQDRRPYRW